MGHNFSSLINLSLFSHLLLSFRVIALQYVFAISQSRQAVYPAAASRLTFSQQTYEIAIRKKMLAEAVTHILQLQATSKSPGPRTTQCLPVLASCSHPSFVSFQGTRLDLCGDYSGGS